MSLLLLMPISHSFSEVSPGSGVSAYIKQVNRLLAGREEAIPAPRPDRAAGCRTRADSAGAAGWYRVARKGRVPRRMGPAPME